MDRVTKEDIDSLIENHESPCVSFYMKAERFNNQAQVNITLFKNLLKEAGRLLREKNYGDSETEKLFGPVKALLEDRLFWEKQGNGLAVFLSPGYFRYFKTEVSFTNMVKAGGSFFIQPLIPLVTNNAVFYVLGLSKKGVKMYKCDRFGAVEVKLNDVPATFDKYLKFNTDEKHQQAHTNRERKNGRDPAVFHGQGGAKEKENREIENYFHMIDTAVKNAVNREPAPLVLAGSGYLTGSYKKINTYSGLEEGVIEKNPEDMDKKEILDKGWSIVSEKIIKEKQGGLDKFRSLKGTGRTSEGAGDIIKKAEEGRVEILFIPAESIDGRDVMYKLQDESTDAAALRTLAAKGRVYVVEPAVLSGRKKPAAVLRY